MVEEDSYKAITSLGKAMEELAQTSDGLASAFGRVSEKSKLWNITSRILSGSGLWKLQNYVRAVGNAINLYEQNQLKANQATIQGMETIMSLSKRYTELGKELREVNVQQGYAYELQLKLNKGNTKAAKIAAKTMIQQTRQNLLDRINLLTMKQVKKMGAFDDIKKYLGESKGKDGRTRLRTGVGNQTRYTNQRAFGGYAGTQIQKIASGPLNFMRAKGGGDGNNVMKHVMGKGAFLIKSMSKVFGPLATVSKLIPKIYSMMLPFLSIGLGLFIQFSMWLAAIGVGLILLVKIIREGGFMEIFRNINKAFKEMNFDMFGLLYRAFIDIGGGIWDILSAIFKGDFGLFATGFYKLCKGILKLGIALLGILLASTVALFAGLIKGMINTLVDGLNALPLISGIPKLATGGSISSGGMAIVGERGPELVNLPTGARVHSNSASKNMGRGDIHIHVNGRLGASDAELRDLSKKVAQVINVQMNRNMNSFLRFGN